MDQPTLNYLSPPAGSFWRWGDGGGVLVWSNGQTIAFAAELEPVLTRLASRGLPSLGSILLLLAATRDNWAELSAPGGPFATMLPKESHFSVGNLLTSVQRGLQRVAKLDPSLRNGMQAKAELADLVFEECKQRTSPELADAVVKQLRLGVPMYAVESYAEIAESWVPLRDLESLFLGLHHVDADLLRLRAMTGLDDTLLPAEVEVDPATKTRELLKQLLDDEELSGLARLTHNLMAAVTLPRAVSDQEDLPLGGISDISNRGPLDRLLLSELAHDDLTLSVRVATGEALYLRRELPPRIPPRQRCLLLETGIRSWGVPRVFATAVALALAATTDKQTSVFCYRAQGPNVVPVDLTTREGIVAQLAALDAEPHPGAALQAFEQVVADNENPGDSVLIASEAVLQDREFQRALDARELLPLHFAAVDRDGHFRLMLRSQRGVKVLREATLNLDDLFAPHKQKTPLIERDRLGLPALFGVRPFPLLLPHNFHEASMMEVHELGVLAVTSDRRLMLWSHRSRAARQLSDELLPGQLVWALLANPKTQVTLLLRQGRSGPLSFCSIQGDSGVCRSHGLHPGQEHCRAIFSTCGVLGMVHERHVDVFRETNGEYLLRAELPERLCWQRDRFFLDPKLRRWFAFGFDGLAARFESVVDESAYELPQLLSLVEPTGSEGPLGISIIGAFYSLSAGLYDTIHNLPRSIYELVGVSRLGERVVLREPATKSSYLVEVRTRQATLHPGTSPPEVERFRDIVRPLSVRRQFTHIGHDAAGSLVLTSHKQKQWAIVREAGIGRVLLIPSQLTRDEVLQSVPFKRTASPPGRGYGLSVATWADGSRAFLDSRGLLHLQSADHSIPETTIVLADEHLGGWCADGTLWGNRYFTDVAENPGVNLRIFTNTIEAFAQRLR